MTYLQKLLHVPFPVIHIYHRQILGHAVAGPVPHVLRQIDVVSRLEKIKRKLLIFRCTLRKAVADDQNALRLIRRVADDMELWGLFRFILLNREKPFFSSFLLLYRKKQILPPFCQIRLRRQVFPSLCQVRLRRLLHLFRIMCFVNPLHPASSSPVSILYSSAPCLFPALHSRNHGIDLVFVIKHEQNRADSAEQRRAEGCDPISGARAGTDR